MRCRTTLVMTLLQVALGPGLTSMVMIGARMLMPNARRNLVRR